MTASPAPAPAPVPACAYLLLKTVDVIASLLTSERSAISLYFIHHPSARRSFLDAVQQVTGPESCITPAATPAGYAVDDHAALVGSPEAVHRTGTTAVEVDNGAYETPSITNTHDTYLGLNGGVEEPSQEVQNSGTGQHCAVPLSSATANPFPDPFTTFDDLGKYSYAQQASEEDGSSSVRPDAAGSDQFGTGSLQHSERRTAKPLPFFYHTDDWI